LLARVDHWTGSRWSQPARPAKISDLGRLSPPEGPQVSKIDSRADVVHALVRRLAELCAEVEGRPRLAVPRLDNDLAIPDQLRVVVADLRLASPREAAVRRAVADIEATTARL
jgi:hypothetical protein